MRALAAGLLLAASAAWQSTAAADQVRIWTKDVFGARHAQSGFACPHKLLTSREHRSALDSVTLQNLIVGTERPNGQEVGYEYEGINGAWATVEIIRLRPNEASNARYEATLQRIKARYPTLLGVSNSNRVRPKSPTGGRTYVAGYYNAEVGKRYGAVAAAAGEVGGWMVTLIQFDYEDDGTGLHFATATNWQTIADSRP
jgi:hypothetical protein